MQEDIEKKIIETEDNNLKVNWTKAWGRKYKVLNTYQNEVDVLKYSSEIRKLLDSLKSEYGYSELDAVLVLKDILYHEMKK